MAEWKITQINAEHMNEFQHRQVVFTRIKSIGNGVTIPYARAIQIWDVATDQLKITIEPVFEDLEANGAPE